MRALATPSFQLPPGRRAFPQGKCPSQSTAWRSPSERTICGPQVSCLAPLRPGKEKTRGQGAFFREEAGWQVETLVPLGWASDDTASSQSPFSGNSGSKAGTQRGSLERFVGPTAHASHSAISQDSLFPTPAE